MADAEPILDPDLPICDAHHHLWTYAQNPYLPEQLLGDTGSGHRVVSTVHVECRHAWRTDGPEALRPVGETEWVAACTAGLASPTRVAAGIVAFADLALGDAVAPVLEAHLAASPRVRGVRHMAAWDASDAIHNSATNPPPGLLSDPAFRAGLARLARAGLVFDAWVYHPQVPEVTALARALPGLTIVLDHLGGPVGIGPYAGRREEVFRGWREDIRELARCPNVRVKLGGMAMSLSGFGWHRRPEPPGSAEIAAALAPWFRACIEDFGPARCMLESNFPVDRVSCSYATLWNAFKRICADLAPAERRALAHDTAVATYRLD